MLQVEELRKTRRKRSVGSRNREKKEQPCCKLRNIRQTKRKRSVGSRNREKKEQPCCKLKN